MKNGTKLLAIATILTLAMTSLVVFATNADDTETGFTPAVDHPEPCGTKSLNISGTWHYNVTITVYDNRSGELLNYTEIFVRRAGTQLNHTYTDANGEVEIVQTNGTYSVEAVYTDPYGVRLDATKTLIIFGNDTNFVISVGVDEEAALPVAAVDDFWSLTILVMAVLLSFLVAVSIAKKVGK